MNKTGFCKTWNLFVISIALLFNVLTAEAQTQSTRLSIHLDKVPMERIVNEIEQQTRYLFLFNKDIDSKQITVSVNATDKTVLEILPLLFEGTGLGYTVEGMNILVTKTDSAAKNVPNSGKISGTVTDPSGHPVVGASVLVKGTTVGATTDVDGRFALTVPPPAATKQLEISFLGYNSLVLPVGNRTNFDITLHESSYEIDEVVVTALGIKRDQKALAYTVAQVTSDDVTRVKDANFINSLSGKVAGAVINSSSSGVGGVSKVTMRGMKSIMHFM